jgi:hypothetical protein
MGQAKNRKAEIMALKATGPKFRNVIMFGAYYKDLDDDGVAIQFQEGNEAKPGLTKMLYKTLTQVKAGGLEEVRAGTWCVPEIWAQLKDSIVNFNIKCFGSAERPQQHNYTIDVIACMDEIIVIMGNIWILEQLGEIQSDNYNGMLFGYTD